MAAILAEGALRKMETTLLEGNGNALVNYQLVVGEERINMQPLIGSFIKMEYTGAINCMHCGRKVLLSLFQKITSV